MPSFILLKCEEDLRDDASRFHSKTIFLGKRDSLGPPRQQRGLTGEETAWFLGKLCKLDFMFCQLYLRPGTGLTS
jgi:hypothetical protein